MRHVLVLCLAVLAACAPRGDLTMMPQAASVGTVQRVFIGTTRQTDASGGYDGKRSEALSFARYDISIPPERELGEISWPKRGRTPDPTTDFLTTDRMRFDAPGKFRAELAQAMAASRGDAVIFVHGFNNTFSEGLYRIAQLSHDLEMNAAIVHYSWPSAAEPLGYVYDRDSAMFARDGLESVIRQVRESGARRITLVAHSMGSALLMESLRQMSIRGDTASLSRISGVVLISPDIDVDLFRMQAKAMDRLPQPFLIFGSDKDKVLRLSALLTGQSERLGTLTDITRLADLEVTYLDIAAFSEGSGHFTLGNSPVLLQLLGGIGDVGRAFDSDRAGQTDLLTGSVLTVRTATRVVLDPVVQIGNELRRAN